jgi:predicted porin
VAPTFEARNFTIGYSYWSQKATRDRVAAVRAATSDQRGDRLLVRIAGVASRSARLGTSRRSKNGGTLAVESRQSYRMVDSARVHLGSALDWRPLHQGRDDKATAVQDGARMWALGYNYSLSKRTSLGVTYASIRNDEARRIRRLPKLAASRRGANGAGWRRSAFLVDDDPARVLSRHYPAGAIRPQDSNGRSRTPVFFCLY